MKRLLFLLLSLTVGLSVSAQFTGGGSISPGGAAASTSDKVSGSDKDIMFLKFGLAFPSSDLKSYNFKTGIYVEMPVYGTFSRKSQLVKGGMVFCIPEFAYYSGSKGTYTNSSGSLSNDFVLTTGLKLGPSITVFPANDLFINAYYALHPTIIGGRINGLPVAYDNDGYGTLRFSFMSSIGMNVKYNVLMLGMEYNIGKLKYMLTETNESEMNASSFRVTLGIRFQ